MFRRITKLPAIVGERIGLFEPAQPSLAPGQKLPKHTFRWDLDKTYLRTEFDSLKDLAKSAIETAADKQAYPGATALLRALRNDEHWATMQELHAQMAAHFWYFAAVVGLVTYAILYVSPRVL